MEDYRGPTALKVVKRSERECLSRLKHQGCPHSAGINGPCSFLREWKWISARLLLHNRYATGHIIQALGILGYHGPQPVQFQLHSNHALSEPFSHTQVQPPPSEGVCVGHLIRGNFNPGVLHIKVVVMNLDLPGPQVCYLALDEPSEPGKCPWPKGKDQEQACNRSCVISALLWDRVLNRAISGGSNNLTKPLVFLRETTFRTLRGGFIHFGRQLPRPAGLQ